MFAAIYIHSTATSTTIVGIVSPRLVGLSFLFSLSPRHKNVFGFAFFRFFIHCTLTRVYTYPTFPAFFFLLRTTMYSL